MVHLEGLSSILPSSERARASGHAARAQELAYAAGEAADVRDWLEAENAAIEEAERENVTPQLIDRAVIHTQNAIDAYMNEPA